MIQNIKVDIVYYMTATDFEFEFNLGSCCHMRLLNDKVKDKRAYLNSLARAVSRSKIILCVGPVFGDDGLISVTSAAIGKGLSVIDNKAFGIADESKIEIIAGGVPLVTPEGFFGGCIVESGPQTIVILTENRTIRKTIMKTLIHPYIEDMCLMQSAVSSPSFVNTQEKPQPETTLPAEEDPVLEEPIYEETSAEPEVPPEAVNAETEEPQTADAEPQEVDAESEDTVPEADGSIFIEDAETEQPNVPEETPLTGQEFPKDAAKDIDFDFSVDKEYVKHSPEVPSDTDGLFIADDVSSKGGKSTKGINISIIIITALLLLAVLALCYFLVFLPLKNGVSTIEYIKQLFGGVSSTTSV